MKTAARSLWLANPDAKEDDGLVWKTAVRTGRWEVSPNGGASKPLVFLPGRSPDLGTAVGLQDIVDSFEDGAVEHVTVPKSHQDKVDENTGYVRKLKIVDMPNGHQELKAGIEFTDPEIHQKVINGSIANSSVGLKFGYQRKEDAKIFPVALDHMALTNKPWLNKLAGFGLSEKEEEGDNVAILNFSEESTEIVPEAEVPTKSEKIEKFVKIGDVTLTADQYEAVYQHRLAEEKSSSSSTTTLDDQDTTTPKGTSEMTEAEKKAAAEKAAREEAERQAAQQPVGLSEDQVKELVKPVSDQNAILLAEIATLRAQNRAAETDKFLGTLKSLGLSEENGCTEFLKETRAIMLADQGQAVLTLSTEGDAPDLELSAADIVKRLLSALPTDEKTGKLKLTLSQQTTDPLGTSISQRPPATSPGVDTTVHLSEEEKQKHYDEMFARLSAHA